MERERPTFVKRYTAALAVPAITRWHEDQAHRELAEERSMQVIQAPLDANLSTVSVSREFDFLRDFWNLFHECIQSCEALDLIRDLASDSMESAKADRHTATVTFWMESYLNEVYIFQSRLLDLVKFIQRRYKKDKDFTEFVTEVGDSLADFVKGHLAPLIQDRGAHVHERRHRTADPIVVKQTLLDTMIDVLGHMDLEPMREQSRKDTTAWLATQLRHFSELAWHLLDEVCRGFSDGILLQNDRIIVPLHLKDNTRAFLDVQQPDI